MHGESATGSGDAVLILRLRRLRALRKNQRRDAYHGLLFGLAMMVFVVAGSLLFSDHPGLGWVVLTGSLACCTQVAVHLIVPWERVDARTVLLMPGVWLLGLLAISLQVGAFASNFVGLTVLAFLFGGITQRRWQTLWLLPLAFPTWLVMATGQGGATSLWLRLPIVILLWVSASELVSRRTHSISSEVRRLNRAVDVDELTGLANRRVLPAALTSARSGDALILIDIDHFKQVNDEHGHTTGDVVLSQFCRRIARCIRTDDEAIRYGGEEILVILRQPTAAGVQRFDQRLRAELQSMQPAVTYSAGSALIRDGESAQNALERADELLYGVKRSGRNRIDIDIDVGAPPDDLTPDERPTT